MASKENQEALNSVVSLVAELTNTPLSYMKVSSEAQTLQQAINDLELYEKEKEIAKRIFNDTELCYREEEEFLEYIEEKARKELESEKQC